MDTESQLISRKAAVAWSSNRVEPHNPYDHAWVTLLIRHPSFARIVGRIQPLADLSQTDGYFLSQKKEFALQIPPHACWRYVPPWLRPGVCGPRAAPLLQGGSSPWTYPSITTSSYNQIYFCTYSTWSGSMITRNIRLHPGCTIIRCSSFSHQISFVYSRSIAWYKVPWNIYIGNV